MKKWIISKFLGAYKDKSYLIKTKATSLFILNTIVAFIVIANIVIVEIIITKDIIAMLIELAWLVIIVSSLILVVKGKCRIAGTIAIICYFVAIIVLTASSYGGGTLFLSIRFIFLLSSGMVYAFSTSIGKKLPFAVFILSILSVFVYNSFLFHSISQNSWRFVWFGTLVSALMIMIFIGITMYVNSSVYADSIILLEKEMDENTQRANKVISLESRFRTIVDSINEAIFIHDPLTGEILDINKKALEMYQCSRDAMIQSDLSTISSNISPYTLSDALEMIRKTCNEGPCVFEWQARDSHSRVFWVEVNMRKGVIDGKECVIATIRDINDRKQSEEEKIRLKEKLLHAEKMDAIGQLAGGIAHDFNNQLTGIMGFSELITNTCDDPEIKSFAEQIVKASRRSAVLTKQLLSFARKESLQIVPVDIHVLLNDIITLLGRSIDKRIRIVTEYQAAAPCVNGDPVKLENAFLNIAINARDAMGKGGVLTFSTMNTKTISEECLEMVQYIQEDQDWIRVSVSDTGSGIDPDTRKRMFEPFFTTKEVGKGTGLGLSAVYGTVQSHSGAICFESNVGEGTTFYIYLPVMKKTNMSFEPESVDIIRIPRKVRILVVDDEEIVRTLVIKQLKADGHTVRVFSNGSSVITYMKEHPLDVDVVLLDIMMPDMSGLEVFTSLRELHPSLKIILFSGYTKDTDIEKMLSQKNVLFIQKPYQYSLLKEKIEEIIG